jgi:enoyl-CoA hydratase/carnithine racemase
MSLVSVSRRDGVAVVALTGGENRFHPDFLDALDAALDGIEEADGPAALVLTGEGKFFSNGLDLDYLAAAGPDDTRRNIGRVHALLARILGFGGFTVAAIGGHAFAAGAMLALACDQRVMRADRGYFCLPEVDLGLPFTPGMQALITSRLSPAAAHEAMVTGRRYGGAQAQARGLVDLAVPEVDVLPEAVRRAAAVAGKSRAAVSSIKRSLFAGAIAALRADAHGQG